MTAADKWCVGWRRDPHVPDDPPTIVTNQGRGAALCRPCWRGWIREETMERQPVELDLLPQLLDAIIELLPTRHAWRELLDAEPGIEVAPDGHGWIAVEHRGDRLASFEPTLLAPDGGTGRVRFIDHGHPVEVHLGRDPEGPRS